MLIISIYPWLLGACLGAYLGLAQRRGVAISLVFMGTGGLLSLLGLGYLISLTSKLGSPLFHWMNVWLLFFCIASSLTLIVKHLLRTPPDLSEVQITNLLQARTLVPLSLLIALLSWFLACNILLPAQGWDTIDYWADKALRVLTHGTAGETVGFINEDRWGNIDRHPMTLNAILAWGAFTKSEGGLLFPSSASVLFSAVLLILGTARSVGRSWGEGLLATYIFCSTPLVENHLALSGYPIIFVAAIVLASSCLITIGLAQSNASYIFAGCLVSLTSIGLKNTGVVYGMLPIMGLFITRLLLRNRPFSVKVIMLLIPIIALIILITVSIYSNFTPFVSYDFNTDTIWALGKQIVIISPSAGDLISVEVTSKIKNLSWSLSSTIIATISLSTLFIWRQIKQEPAIIFLIAIQVLGILILLLSLYSQHGFFHATAGNDTAHSRFTLPIITLTPLLLILYSLFIEKLSRPQTRLAEQQGHIASLNLLK